MITFNTLEEAQNELDIVNKNFVAFRRSQGDDVTERWAFVEEIEVDGVIKYGYPTPPKL